MADLSSVDPIYPRRETTGVVIAVLRTSRIDRGLKLIKERSRCICRWDIHEFIVTDERDPHPGDPVDRIGYLAFVEFETGGVIVSGDVMSIDGRDIGNLVGFDETHAPNHMNIVIRSDDRTDGFARGIKVGQSVSLKPLAPG